MRKLLALATMLCLMSAGCAWLGFGDDESQTTQAQEVEPMNEEAPADPAPEKVAKKETKKTSVKKGSMTEAQIKEALDRKGKQLAQQSARTLLPNVNHKEVSQRGDQWIATYMNVDTEHVTTDMKPKGNGQYIGFIHYQEEVMECRGATREAALKAPCQKAGARRLNELIRFDGKEWLD